MDEKVEDSANKEDNQENGDASVAKPTHVPGTARVKFEFLKKDYRPSIMTEFVSQVTKDKMEEITEGNKRKAEAAESEKSEVQSGESPKKKMKLTGRNKKRPGMMRPKDSVKLCPAVLHERDCRFGNKCKFSHDINKFVAEKPADLAESCYTFTTLGKCQYGLACRYGKTHISEGQKNIVNEELYNSVKDTKFVFNTLEKDLQVKLWKKKYDFSKANKNANQIRKETDLQTRLASHPWDQDINENQKSDKSNKYNNTDASSSDCPVPNNKDAEQSDSNQACASSSVEGSGSRDQSEQDMKSAETAVIGTESKNDTGCISLNEATNLSVSTACDTTSDNITELNSPDVSTQLAGSSESSPTKISAVSKCSKDFEGIKLRPQEKKLIDFSNKLYLAPLTTVGNLPYRRICKEYGADITCGEMALATNLLQGQQSEWALLKRHVSEDLFGVQICGGWADTLTRCSQLINDELDVDFVDLNCGCPIDLVFKKGEGCALMGKSTKFGMVVRSMKSVLDVPLTVKMRTGIQENRNVAHRLAPKLRDWGVSLLTIHGRSREQRYTRSADWEYIEEVAKLANPMPVFGNGDILSYEDLDDHMKNHAVKGCMIARGALIKPWIFKEIKERQHWDISASERFDMLKSFTNYGLMHWGSDDQGVERVRRFLLEWLSFLYRYIPVGVLEQVPQKINERPPYYIGRNDLETLLSSSNCGDWIKISEMLLGPTPEGFHFLPKHKANAYK